MPLFFIKLIVEIKNKFKKKNYYLQIFCSKFLCKQIKFSQRWYIIFFLNLIHILELWNQIHSSTAVLGPGIYFNIFLLLLGADRFALGCARHLRRRDHQLCALSPIDRQPSERQRERGALKPFKSRSAP
jgi:hypothetical protein